MTNKRSHNEYTQRRELNAAGWPVSQKDVIAVHAAEETSRHFSCKAKVGWFLNYNDYRIDSEVQKEGDGPIADVIAYGNGEPAFIVECETGITPQKEDEKMEQFYYNEPFSEVYPLEVNDMPADHMEALAWIQDELGGELP